MLPREKAKLLGIQNLSYEELFALIIGQGSRKESVFQLAKRLTRVFRKRGFSFCAENILKHECSLLEGVGEATRLRISAVFELMLRVCQTENQFRITSTTDVLKMMHSLVRKKKEYVYALYLDSSRRLLSKKLLALGGIDFVNLDLRSLFSHALVKGATGIILVHNHPSGEANPSKADLVVTERVINAGKILGIELIDHIILARGGYFSFSESML